MWTEGKLKVDVLHLSTSQANVTWNGRIYVCTYSMFGDILYNQVVSCVDPSLSA